MNKAERRKLNRGLKRAAQNKYERSNKAGKLLAKADKLEAKRQTLLKDSDHKTLRSMANMHLGNKLLKPDGGWWRPTESAPVYVIV
jgi:hypothetical protein